MAAAILITGANGFIGPHFTQLMESLGRKVIPIDNVPCSPDLSFEIGQHPNAAEVGRHRNRDPLDITLAKKV